jgi:hypothetical protein
MGSSILTSNPTETSMNTAHAIAEQYLAAWNERDSAARRDRVTRLFTQEATYVDPLMRGLGHTGIDALIAGAQQHFPGHRFALAGQPDGHNDVVRFSWTLNGADGAPVARGTDVARLGADGRLASVTGFLDQAA